jgi:hypothetical protein
MWGSMQKMLAQIAAFTQFMYARGYDGTFVSDYGFPSKLRDNLVQHALQCLQEMKPVDKVLLKTYTHLKDGDNPQIRCGFQVEYSMQHGFQPRKMTIEKDSLAGTYHRKELAIRSLDDVPAREDLPSMMTIKRHRQRL